jgi:hypothetical protein
VRRSVIKNFLEKGKNFLGNFWIQRVCKGLLKTQRLMGMKKWKVKSKWPRKNHQKWVVSLVWSPILLSGKLVGEDTNISP